MFLCSHTCRPRLHLQPHTCIITQHFQVHLKTFCDGNLNGEKFAGFFTFLNPHFHWNFVRRTLIVFHSHCIVFVLCPLFSQPILSSLANSADKPKMQPVALGVALLIGFKNRASISQPIRDNRQLLARLFRVCAGFAP